MSPWPLPGESLMATGHPELGRGSASSRQSAPQDIYLQVTRATVVALSVSWCSSELPKGVPLHAQPRTERDNGLLSRTFQMPQFLSTSSAIL